MTHECCIICSIPRVQHCLKFLSRHHRARTQDHRHTKRERQREGFGPVLLHCILGYYGYFQYLELRNCDIFTLLSLSEANFTWFKSVKKFLSRHHRAQTQGPQAYEARTLPLYQRCRQREGSGPVLLHCILGYYGYFQYLELRNCDIFTLLSLSEANFTWFKSVKKFLSRHHRARTKDCRHTKRELYPLYQRCRQREGSGPVLLHCILGYYGYFQYLELRNCDIFTLLSLSEINKYNTIHIFWNHKW